MQNTNVSKEALKACFRAQLNVLRYMEMKCGRTMKNYGVKYRQSDLMLNKKHSRTTKQMEEETV